MAPSFVAYASHHNRVNVFRLNDTKQAIYDPHLLHKMAIKVPQKVQCKIKRADNGKVRFETTFGQVNNTAAGTAATTQVSAM